MPRSVNQRLLDLMLRHAIQTARLRKGEAAKIGRLIQGAIPGIERDVADRLTRMTSGRSVGKLRAKQLEALQRELEAQLEATKWAQILSSDLRDISLTEAARQVSILTEVVPAELALQFRAPSTALLRSIVTSNPFEGRVLKQWTAGVSASTTDRVSRVVNLGLVRGDDIPTMSRAVRNQLRITRSQAESVTRTAVTHVSAQAREETYDENDDVVKGVKWVSTLDSRTSNICKSLDGKVFPVDEGPRPPAHFNCRSTTTPVLKSWEELGIKARELSPTTRASMNGQVPADQTYQDWLEEQPESVQNDALGPGRAKLFREGKITVDELVDEDLRPLTLEELRREARAA